ncbi:XrtA-associated tyrosine autokinase [Fundidesulfovibrio terrae]|uniref:XrtA-associated tyrosine autokinase n=1 Tax=Fundidesulfovibrio terrae TaxID=2922866 RepID=UPI001FAF260F|nr:XrtA-associated tyrosine autokinase [Fundidesulfovibrio terrae]
MSRIEEALNKAIEINQVQQPRAARASAPPPNTEGDAVVVPNDHMLLTLTTPNSPAAEEYRKLKEAIIKETGREGFNNVLLVTSVNPGEGKTVTTLNLAVSLAHEFDYTVLLVDADLRAPACNKYLGIESEKGLSDCLENDTPCTDVLVRTGIGRLVLFPAGKPVANPVELISSSKMRNLITELKHRYPDRFILIDSPPAKFFAETRFLASMADASVMVVREGESSLDEIAETAAALDNRVIGIVYNGARENPFSKASQYHYYAYSQPEEAGQ